jgi:hypothetical protein
MNRTAKSIISIAITCAFVFANQHSASAAEKKLSSPYDAYIKGAEKGEFGKRYKMVAGYLYNAKSKQWDLPTPMYVTISKFDIYDRATDCPNGIISGDVSRDCKLRYSVDVKVENPSDEIEASNVSVQMWCKNSKKNYQNNNFYSDDFQNMLYSLPPMSEDTGAGIMVLPRDISGPAKCESPGVFIKSQNGATKAAKRDKYVATIYFPIEKLLILDPNVLG